jgi:hypothetical protein
MNELAQKESQLNNQKEGEGHIGNYVAWKGGSGKRSSSGNNFFYAKGGGKKMKSAFADENQVTRCISYDTWKNSGKLKFSMCPSVDNLGKRKVREFDDVVKKVVGKEGDF